VAAENAVGVGPFTSALYARTFEDGTLYVFVQKQVCNIHASNISIAKHPLSLPAPAAPPQDAAVHNITSTSFTLTWEPPPLELQNGVIRSYTITITEVETENTFHLESLTTSIVVGSLHPYYTYVVSIHAITILAGPQSDMFEVITLPEGK